MSDAMREICVYQLCIVSEPEILAGVLRVLVVHGSARRCKSEQRTLRQVIEK